MSEEAKLVPRDLPAPNGDRAGTVKAFFSGIWLVWVSLDRGHLCASNRWSLA